MLKKALYVISSCLLALLLTFILIGFNFVSAMQSHIQADIEKGDYTSAEKFYAIALDSNKFYSNTLSDGKTYLEVLPAINADNGIVVQKVEATEDSSENSEEAPKDKVTYYAAYESSIQFTLFNVSSDFDMSSDTFEKKNGKLVVTVSDKTITFPYFRTETSSFYASYPSFQYFTACIFYDDYVEELEKLGLPETTSISKVEIFDGAGKSHFTVEFAEDSQPSFDTEFHKTVNPLCYEYNKQQEAFILEQKEVTVDLVKLKMNLMDAFGKIEGTTFQNGYEVSIIFTSKECLVPTAIGLLIFMVLDVALAIFLFRKKKNTGRRRNSMFAPKYNYQPKTQKFEAPKTEQFSRDVFNVRDEILASDNDIESSNETEEKVEE